MTKKLLVMDENTTIQRVVKLAFREEAIQVITVPRGQDAFTQIERELPDIVLADKGREVAAFLKTRPQLSRIPVVLLQGAFDQAVESGDKALGCDAVLMKPLQPQALIDCVAGLLLKHTAAAAAAAPIRSTPVERSHPPDSEMDLDRYFDGLAVAFSSAERGLASPPFGDGWMNPIRPPDVVASVTATPPRRTTRVDAEVDAKLDANANNEAFIELITQRVLDRVADRVTRAAATELVARLSKWLLVDEVERSRA